LILKPDIPKELENNKIANIHERVAIHHPKKKGGKP